MAENSRIEWTDNTLNFWWGCVKVSPGCEHCYAETLSKRVGRNIWGPAKTTDRWRTKGPWRDVVKWNAKAQAEGVRRKVFCQSMSDFFEDHPQVAPWRAEACEILESLTWLDVQLLTKRPENVNDMVPAHWLDNWPVHIWIGTSVEDQKRADERIPHLLRIPAKVRFLSMEPLLGSVDLGHAIPCGYYCDPGPDGYGHHDHPFWTPGIISPIHWVIVGGESGHNARPMKPDWARSIRDQCQAAGVPLHFKQWGEWVGGYDNLSPELARRVNVGDVPRADGQHDVMLYRFGKHDAGRLLDGREWNEFPKTEVQNA